MPSSTDIAQLFAAQQGQFSQQNYFAQTIGVQQMGMGLGGTGFFAPSAMQPAPGPPPPPGVAAPPPVFSYAPGGLGALGPGYGAGNAFAGHVMSGIGGMAAAGGVGMGLASMLAPSSFLGKVGSFMDPVSAFLRAGPAMPIINAGGTGTLAAGLGAAAGPLALGMGLSMAGQSVIHGAQQQQQIGAQLGQFGFLNSASRTGMGFTRQDATEIGGTIRQLGHLPEMLSSVEELTRMLPKMRQMGVMSGVKDAAEFSRRFKETITTVRDMSKMLNTSLEEASTMFAHNRQVGFTTTKQQLTNTLALQYTSGATGMTMDQVMGLQAGGASIARSFGARGRYGAQGVTNIVQKLQSGLEAGVIDEGLLTDITGQVGDEAKQSTAQMMLQASFGLTQSPAGQALMAGLLKRGEDGRFELDQNLLSRVGRGAMSLDEIKARGSGLGDAAKMAFKGPQGKNLSAQLAASGVLPGFISSLVSQHGEEGAELLMDKYTGGQLSQPMIEGLLKLGKGGGGGMGLEEFAGLRGREMNIQNRTDPRQMWERLKRKIHSGTFGKLEEVGAEANQAIAKAYEDFVDDLVGRRVVSLSKEGAEAFRQAMRGGDSGNLRALFSAKGSMGTGAWDPSGGFFSGGSEAGAAVIRLFGDGTNSGRSAMGSRTNLTRESGLSGTNLDKWMNAAQTGAVGQAGIGARAVYDRLVGAHANRTGRDLWNKKDMDVRFTEAQDVLAAEMYQGLARAGLDIEGLGSGGFDIDTAVKRAGGIDAVLAKLDATGGAGDAAALFRAAKEHKAAMRKLGIETDHNVISWKAAAVAGSDKAETLAVVPKAASSGLMKSLRDSAQADKVMREAESSLTDAGLKGEEASIVRSNGMAREILNYIKTNRGFGDRVLNMGDEAALREIKKQFPGATIKDVQDVRKVWAAASTNPSAWDAIGKYAVTKAAGDAVAIQKRVGDMAGGLAEAAGNSNPAIASAAKALATAMTGFSLADNSEEWDYGIQGMRKHAGALAAAYHAEKDETKKQALRESMGAAGVLLDSIGGAYGSTSLSYEKAVQLAGGKANLETMAPGFAAGQTLTGDALTSFQNKLAGNAFGNLIRPGTGSGGAAGPSTELEALQAIAKNAKLQTDILILLAKEEGVSDKSIQEKLAGSNPAPPNEVAGGAVPVK